MRLSFNSVNACTKIVNVYQMFTRNMTVGNKTQMVLSLDNSIVVSNGHQPPVTSSRQPSMKFIHPIIAQFCIKSWKSQARLSTNNPGCWVLCTHTQTEIKQVVRVIWQKGRIADAHGRFNRIRQVAPMCTAFDPPFVSDIAIFVLKRDVKLQLTN